MNIGVPLIATQSDRTSDCTLTKLELITLAHKIIGVLEPGQVLDADQLADGEQLLCLIVRETDGSGRWKWTIPAAAHVPMLAGVVHYAVENGLPSNILELETVCFRDAQGFDHPPLKLLTAQQYESIANKVETGIPRAVFLSLEANQEDRILAVWPVPASVAVQSMVVDDSKEYHCIRAHTASIATRPLAGANWRLYWEGDATTAIDPWTNGATYTASEQLRLLYRRPLLDFNAPDDTPDFPRTWPRLLLYKLAFDLGDVYSIPVSEREIMIKKAKGAYDDIFGSLKQNNRNARHNKVSYF